MKNTEKWKRGLPYVGNKGQKAQMIIDSLPEGKRLIDVFGGGGSVSLHAKDSCKWENVIYNDQRESVVTLLKTLIENPEKINLMDYVYITREDFFDWKNNKSDSIERTLVLLVWYFSNNMENYLFGRNIESQKLQITRAIFYGDTNTPLDDIFKETSKVDSIADKYSIYHKWRRQRLQQLERLQQLQRLQCLEPKNIDLIYSVKDYRDLEIKEDDVVYCDPPYVGTGYQYDGFEGEAFDEWLNNLPTDNIYISEYTQLPNTEVYLNLGSKLSLKAAGTRRSELLLKYKKHS